MANLTIFKEEIESISSAEIQSVVCSLLGKVPAYFWEVAASSSGKYHPAYALGKGGLVRHTKAAVKFFNELKDLEFMNLTDEEKDYCIAALILHDSQKQGDGKEGYTVFDHPVLAANFVKNNAPEWFASKVAPLIASHMGQWNTSKYAEGIVLPKPEKKLEGLVHMCDYLASRKCFVVQL